MDEEELLLLAFGIAEWQTVLDHILAVGGAGHRIPYGMVGRTQKELERMCIQWSLAHGEAWLSDDGILSVVRQAREFCTERVGQIDELLRRK